MLKYTVNRVRDNYKKQRVQKENFMKKRLLVLTLALIMLLGNACATVPENVINGAEELDGNILSSDEAILANAVSESTVFNVVATDMVSIRGGEWANMTWRQIMDKRIELGQLSADTIVVKNGVSGSNGMTNNSYTRVALFKYDISDITVDDIGYASFQLSFSAMETTMDVPFDIYWVDENWNADKVTFATKPALVEQNPVIDDFITKSVERYDATELLKKFIASGRKEIALMVVQTVITESESRISSVKANELSYPHFSVYRDSSLKDDAYIKKLVVDEAENKAIWDYAKQMFDEWYVRYEMLKNTPLEEAELIVSDPTQYNKISKSPGTNPNGTNWKEHKTRTYGDLTDMSKYVDVTAEPQFDKYGGIMDEQMRQEATGFFYSTKIGDRWWIIDPLGYPCYIRALSGITYSYQNSPKQKAAAYELFGTLDKWAIATTRHLMDDLYFNAGAGPAT